MMFHHDGLRIITAENARHSSYYRAPPSDPPLTPLRRVIFLTSFLQIIRRFRLLVTLPLRVTSL